MDKVEVNTLKLNTQMSTSEALLILQGSPSKPSKVNITASAGRTEGSIDPLLQFELRFDALKTYLEGFTTVINQHATIINSLQTDIQTRLIESNLYEVVQKLGASSVIKDKSIATILNQMLQAPKPENTGKKQEDLVNSFCNRLELFTHGFGYFNKMNAAFQERCDKIEAQVAKKVNIDDFKIKVKKTKKKLREQMEENYNKLDHKVKDLDVKVDNRIGVIDRKIDELEKKLTWKIRDLDDLIKSRINDTYVDDSIRLLEERLMKEIERTSFGSTEVLKTSINELASRLKKCEDNIEEKASSLKKNIKDVEVMVSKKVDILKFEEFKKEILARLDADSEKVRNMSRKCEPVIDSLTGDVGKLNEEISQIRKQMKTMSEEIEELMLRPVSTVTNTQVVAQAATTTTTAEINKEELEAHFMKYKLEINRLKETVRTLEETIHSKVDVSDFSAKISKKLDRSEFEALLNSIQSENEKMKRLLQTNDSLQDKFSKIEELIDKKIAKLKKDLDLTNILKQLKSKAEEDNVIKGFENTDKKINALSENLFALKKELDQALATLEKFSLQMVSAYDSASLSTKRINPLACLSCGNMAKAANPVHTVMGTDGKFYRADNNYMQEVYDSVSSPDLRSTLTKTTTSRDDKVRTVNIAYTSVQGVLQQRPQTATSRGKMVKNALNLPSSPTQAEFFAVRPNSAKK